ncbi:hypothetical protein ACHAXA_009792, partial [Cyclostephanos tholiformis]
MPTSIPATTTTTDNLRNYAHAALSSLASDVVRGDTPRYHDASISDVCRALRDARSLCCCFLNMMRVVSCHRIATPHGYSSISAIVQFDNDDKMGLGVKDNVRLKFDFLREPTRSRRRGHRRNSVSGSDVFDNDGAGGRCEFGSGEVMPDEQNQRCSMNGERKRKRTVDDDDDIVAKNGFGEGNGKCPEHDSDGDVGAVNRGRHPLEAATAHETTITYKIDYSIDYGEMKPLLGVYVYALGDHPSIEPPVPIVDDDGVFSSMSNEGEKDEDDEENDDYDVIDGRGNDYGTNGREIRHPPEGNKGKESEEGEMSEYDGGDFGQEDTSIDLIGNGTTKGDKFGVFVNPENVVGFLDRVNINLDERSVFHFLLTFPFYEHEWDIAGFLFSALFDDDDDDDEADENIDGDGEYPHEEN